METVDLIRLIAADAKAPAPKVGSLLVLAWGAGVLVSLYLFLVLLGFRDDLSDQVGSWRFLTKVLVVWIAVGISAWDCIRLSRPIETQPIGSLNWLLVVLLGAALLLEATTLPASQWTKSLFGENWLYCLAFVPTLAMAPLVATFLAFRKAAPSSPLLAGAALGRLAAATGAGLYALHCPDDSPFFVLAWYGVAAIAVTTLAALLGARLLRW